MNVARGLERRLERIFEAVAGRVFSGRLHPSELAEKLAREADFARFEHPSGPATANLFVIQVNPRDLSVDASELVDLLQKEMVDYTTEEGLRLEGPIEVTVSPTEATPSGVVRCHVEVAPGPPVVWARISGDTETAELGRNRVILGRSRDSDVTLSHDDISRRHALIYRQGGQSWIRDLSSANGTIADGVVVAAEPIPIANGSLIDLAEHRYRFTEL